MGVMVLSSIVAILTGKSKVKITALVSVVLLLYFDSNNIVEIPETEIGNWFQYGLKVSVLALFSSLSIDALSSAFKMLRDYYSKVREDKKTQKARYANIVGNLNSLSDLELYVLLFIHIEYGGECKVDINFNSEVCDMLESLFEQQIVTKVGGTVRVPRVSIEKGVNDLLLEKGATDYNRLREQYDERHRDSLFSLVNV